MLPLLRSLQLIEQCLGHLQVSGVDAFGEPAVDGGKEIAGLDDLALRVPEAGKAARGTKFPNRG